MTLPGSGNRAGPHRDMWACGRGAGRWVTEQDSHRAEPGSWTPGWAAMCRSPSLGTDIWSEKLVGSQGPGPTRALRCPVGGAWACLSSRGAGPGQCRGEAGAGGSPQPCADLHMCLAHTAMGPGWAEPSQDRPGEPGTGWGKPEIRGARGDLASQGPVFIFRVHTTVSEGCSTLGCLGAERKP